MYKCLCLQIKNAENIAKQKKAGKIINNISQKKKEEKEREQVVYTCGITVNCNKDK